MAANPFLGTGTNEYGSQSHVIQIDSVMGTIERQQTIDKEELNLIN